ncbi:hypothetical protein TNCV_3155391 [Trichonephila clavipes]|nr:hypothetical protein TNCV_3155391 [Trichonephila clavipes]
MQEKNNSTRQCERNNSTGENNSTRQQERNNSTRQQERNNSTLNCRRPPTTACNRLHRLYSRIGFFYLLVIESPDKWEIQSVICFLNARNMSTADIHRQMTEVYGTEAMSDNKV